VPTEDGAIGLATKVLVAELKVIQLGNTLVE
jgi:hypothetical protein